jgi:hypothetical protein
MNDEKEISSKKITSNPTNSGYSSSEQSTTRVSNDNGVGLIIGILIALSLGAVATIFFLNNRSATPLIVPVPGANNTVRENKSTVIERNNTTTKEVKPAETPKVEINVPAPAQAPAAEAPPKPSTPAETPAPTQAPASGNQ